MQLTIQSQKNMLDRIKLIEHINSDLLQRLINSTLPKPILNKYTQSFYNNEKKQLEALQAKIKDNTAIIKYGRKGRKFGRVNPENGIGLALVSKRLRHTLCN